MSDLVSEVARALDPKAWAAMGIGDTMSNANRRELSEKRAQAAIAIVVEKAAEVARDEKVDAEATGEEGDAIYNRACDDVANALLALSDRSRE